ncbi:MAG: glutamate 5-kinase [Blastocatellia bacterium]|nr:glutamate 5-kinase [Blastocatellia bacterium]
MRQDLLSNVKRIVIKIGSSVLVDSGTGLSDRVFLELTAQVAALRQSGLEVVLVSSGAIAAGRVRLGIEGGPRTIPFKQAAAAVGQSTLMQTYERHFAAHGIQTAQVLLTQDDLADRGRFLNARNTLFALLSLECIPIINENDTVVVEEIKLGDNDRLSALVTNLIDADLLIILSDIEGLYDSDPKTNPAAQLIPLVENVDRQTTALAGETKSTLGTGGMATKLEAARTANRYGIPTILARGRRKRVLLDIFEGREIGTFFQSQADALSSRKHWIAFTLPCAGKLILDSGACRAVVAGGKSLLPSGIVEVEGTFAAGDSVACCNETGVEIARGLVSYSSADIEKIKGTKTTDIEARLGFKSFDEVIHRNDLVLTGGN